MGKPKDGFLYRGIEGIYVYILIAVIGFIIVLCMTSFLKSQVDSFTEDTAIESNK